MARLFISYSRADETFARRLASDLSRAGADVWIDVEDIPAGMDWSNAIQQGLDSAEVMLVLVSPESAASENVEDEWKYFKDQNKPLIPIMVRPAKVHFQLHRLQYINFHSQPYDTALIQLREELAQQGIQFQKQRRQPAPPPAREPAQAAPLPPPTIKPPQMPDRPARQRSITWYVRALLFALLFMCLGVVVLIAINVIVWGGEDDEVDNGPFDDPGAVLLRCDEIDLRGWRIAFITDGMWNPDDSFYHLPLNAAEAAAECGATMEVFHPSPQDDLHALVEETTRGGFQIVFLVGGRLADAAIEIAPRKPDIWFITIELEHRTPADNVINISTHEHDAGFLAGVLAGHLATTPLVGGVYGNVNDHAQADYRDGFDEGVHSVNPELTILAQHHPGPPEESFDDPEAGWVMAQELLDQGASVIFAPSYITGDGALTAVATAAGDEGPPPFCIGAQIDRWVLLREARPCLISSVMRRYDYGVAEAIRMILAGDVRTNLIYAPVMLAPFRDLAAHVPPDAVEAVEALAAIE